MWKQIGSREVGDFGINVLFSEDEEDYPCLDINIISYADDEDGEDIHDFYIILKEPHYHLSVGKQGYGATDVYFR